MLLAVAKDPPEEGGVIPCGHKEASRWSPDGPRCPPPPCPLSLKGLLTRGPIGTCFVGADGTIGKGGHFVPTNFVCRVGGWGRVRSIATSSGRPTVILCDRGTMDAAAYMDTVCAFGHRPRHAYSLLSRFPPSLAHSLTHSPGYSLTQTRSTLKTL